MKVYHYSFMELQKIIMNSQLFNCGNNGNIIVWQNNLLKIDRTIYNVLNNYRKNVQDLENIINDSYYCHYNKIDVNQIEYLSSKQENVFLSKLPCGIVYVENIPIGIILYYHHNYQNINSIKNFNNDQIYQVLLNILESLKELEDNYIYQLDLQEKNILYNGIKPELIDLDGNYIDYGYRRKVSLMKMYSDYGEICKSLLKRSNCQHTISELSSYDEANELVKKLK